MHNYVWNMCGICMAYAWNVQGICMGYAWNLYDIYIYIYIRKECALNIHGVRTKQAWSIQTQGSPQLPR